MTEYKLVVVGGNLNLFIYLKNNNIHYSAYF